MICSCGVIYARLVRTNIGSTTYVDSLALDGDILGQYLAAVEAMPTYSELIAQDSIARAQQRLERVVTIACVGDMVLGVNYPDDAPLLPVLDGAHLFEDV